MREIVVILVNIRSLHNVGSIFRTADAAGVKKIYLTGITPAPVDHFGRYRSQLIKVSLGAEKTVPWEKTSSTSRLVKKLKREGYKIFAVEQSKKSISYFTLTDRSKKLCLIVGNEIHGLPSRVLRLADKILEIPMRHAMVRQGLRLSPSAVSPSVLSSVSKDSWSNCSAECPHHPRHVGRGKESLNVAVAFGIVIFDLKRNP